MRVWRIAAIVAVGLCLAGATGAAASVMPHAKRAGHHHARHHGPLTGYWRGHLSRQTSHGVHRRRIVLYINGRQTGGKWRLGSRCYGTLKLDSISYGYHHYLRRLATHGHLSSRCSGGDIDCVKRDGAKLYDTVTAHLGAAWDTSGLLKHVKRARA